MADEDKKDKKQTCPICGEKGNGRCAKCGHWFRPSD